MQRIYKAIIYRTKWHGAPQDETAINIARSKARAKGLTVLDGPADKPGIHTIITGARSAQTLTGLLKTIIGFTISSYSAGPHDVRIERDYEYMIETPATSGIQLEKQFDDGVIQYLFPTTGPGLFRVTVAPSGITVDQKLPGYGGMTWQVIGACADLEDARQYLEHMQNSFLSKRA